MALVRDWLVGLTCAAMITALAEGLTPPGAVRRIGTLTGGLVILLAMVQPLLKLDEGALARSLAQYRAELSAYNGTLEAENEVLMKAIIEEQAGAYILDKAASLGIAGPLEVEVEAEPVEGGYPVPCRVTVSGSLTAGEREALTRQITAGFSIPAERQYYEGGEDG